MHIAKRITCAALACSMLLGNTVYAADFEESDTAVTDAVIQTLAEETTEDVSKMNLDVSEMGLTGDTVTDNIESAEEVTDTEFESTCSAMFMALSENEDAEEDTESSFDVNDDSSMLMMRSAPNQEPAGSTSSITVTEMLEVLSNPDADTQKREACLNLGEAFNLGIDENELLDTLQQMEDDYQSWTERYEQYQQNPAAFETPVAEPVQPRVEFDGTNLRLEKSLETVSVIKNTNGTYSEVAIDDYAETIGKYGPVLEVAVKTELIVNAEATMTLIYEGDTKITQTVRKDNPTDFVITLDCSNSMAENGRYEAMTSALRVLLSQIMENEENSVSIVCFAGDAAVVKVNGKEHFSIADDISVDAIIEALYQPNNFGTCPESGLSAAMDLLKKPAENGGRNNGVLLFTDGQATGLFSDILTRGYEDMLTSMYDAKIVNVTIGDEADVAQYEKYLNPSSPNYKFGTSMIAGADAEERKQNFINHVSYYNIPKLTDQELADKVTEVFSTALTDMITEERELHTTTITEGVLAAVGAGLIDEVPAGFEIVQSSGSPAPTVVGTDADGNATIAFPLTKDETTVTYFVLPKEDGPAIGVVTDFSDCEATLLAAPLGELTATGDYVYKQLPETGEGNSQENDSSSDSVNIGYVGEGNSQENDSSSDSVNIGYVKVDHDRYLASIFAPKWMTFTNWCDKNGYGPNFQDLSEERLEKALKEYLEYVFSIKKAKDRQAALEELVLTFTGDNSCYKNAEHIAALQTQEKVLSTISSTTSSFEFNAVSKVVDLGKKILSNNQIATSAIDVAAAPLTILQGVEIAQAVWMLKDVDTPSAALQSFGILVPALLKMNPLTQIYGKPVALACSLASKLPDGYKNAYCKTIYATEVLSYEGIGSILVGTKWAQLNSNDHENTRFSPQNGPSVSEVMMSLQNIASLSKDDPFWKIVGAKEFVEYIYRYLHERTVFEYHDVATAMIMK